MKKGFIVGVLAGLAVVAVLVAIPAWWFLSGRDMQTFHDGLSTGFRASLADILKAEGYEAKNEAFEKSVAVTERDSLLRDGQLTPGQIGASPVTNYISWQHTNDLHEREFNHLLGIMNDPTLSRAALPEFKAQANTIIESMKVDHKMLSDCEDELARLVRDSKQVPSSACPSAK